MSWSNAGSFRNVNPLVNLSYVNNGQVITVYQPGVLNPATIKPDITYSGLITNLRVKVQISSLLQDYIIPPQGDQTPEEYALTLNQYDVNSPKKGLNFYLETSLQPPVLLVQLYLFQRRPFYVIDALSYFTNSITLDLASDAKLTVKTQDLGWGELIGRDSIAIWGTAIEEQENAIGTFSITCTGGGSGGLVNLGTVLGYDGQPVIIDGGFADVA
jgi:hypothetical protein